MSQYFSRRPWREYGLLPTSSSSSEPLFLPSMTDSPFPKDVQEQEKRSVQSVSGKMSFLAFRLPKRYTRLVIATLVSLVVFLFLEFDVLSSAILSNRHRGDGLVIPYPVVQDNPPLEDTSGLPPLYGAYREYEDLLSEVHLLERNVTGADDAGRYIFFANHAHTSGWGNVFQEMLFSALLADKAGLGYVWDDYTWDPSAVDYSYFNGKKITARKPISTLLGGHVLGLGEAPPNDAPRAISSRIYERICPLEERVFIDRDTVKEYMLSLGYRADIVDEGEGTEVMNAWLKVLQTERYKDARCIEVRRDTYHVFDIWLFGSSRVRSLWEHISRSPVLTNFGWSPLVHRAFLKNIRLFATDEDVRLRSSSSSKLLKLLFSSPSSSDSLTSLPLELSPSEYPSHTTDPSAPLPVLVLHLRRGDFEEHCMNLAEWSALYTGFNSFPEYRARDRFDVPQIIDPASLNSTSASEGDEEGSNEVVNNVPPDIDDIRRRSIHDPATVASMDERKAVYAKHCYPSTQQIVQRVREIIKDYSQTQVTSWRSSDVDQGKAGKKLKKIYIMTNGLPEWAEEVKRALMQDVAALWSWEGISTSRDLILGWEEKPVAQALDMYVASRAEVFVGNGFSSLTSNIVMLRMKMGFEAIQTRFW